MTSYGLIRLSLVPRLYQRKNAVLVYLTYQGSSNGYEPSTDQRQPIFDRLLERDNLDRSEFQTVGSPVEQIRFRNWIVGHEFLQGR